MTKVDKGNKKRCILAKKIALKLEAIGMRTNYSELFDLFLAETTALWPIAIVFSRPQKNLYLECKTHFFKTPTLIMADDCREAGKFIRQLNCKFRKDCCVTKEIVIGNIENFMPKPCNLEEKSSSLPFGIDCTNQIYVNEVNETLLGRSGNVFDENQKLFCHLIEDSKGIIFMRSTKTGLGLTLSIGHGIAVTRDDAGWSSPCSIGCFGIGGGIQLGCEQSDFIFLIYDEDIIGKIKQGNKFILGGNLSFSGFGHGREYCGLSQLSSNDQTDFPRSIGSHSSFSAFARNNVGALFGVSIEGISMFPIDFINRSMNDHSGATISKEVLEINQALKCAECPYSLSPHPIVPHFLKNYARSVWSIDYSSPLSKSNPLPILEPGHNSRTDLSITLREFLLSFSFQDNCVSVARKSELNNFIDKFKRFLRGKRFYMPRADEISSALITIILILLSFH